MARKTNKTSHVLNLITNGNAEESETRAADSADPATMPTHAEDRKVIVVDASENDKISDEIKDLLEEEVEREEAEQVQAVTQSVNEEVQAEPETASATVEDVSETVTSPEAEATPEAEPELEAAPASESASDAEPEEKEYHIVNVMEAILKRRDIIKEMQQYGVCTCSRCHADVMALSLTRLPSKYVVVDDNPVAPIIGYYENKHKARILTEVMKASIRVKENPRHKR